MARRQARWWVWQIRASDQTAGEWDIPRLPLSYDRAVLAGAVVWGRAYVVVARQQAAMPEQLLPPDADSEPDPRSRRPNLGRRSTRRRCGR